MSALRDVYDTDPADGSAEEQVQFIARAGRLLDASMHRYAYCVAEGRVGVYAGAEDTLVRAEEYLKEATRRFRTLRKLLAEEATDA